MKLQTPLTISGGAITHFTVAEVDVEVVNRSGVRGTGHGESVLSVPWAWPGSALSVEERDAVLRELVRGYAQRATALGHADPIAMWHHLVADIEDVLRAALPASTRERVPKLGGYLALGAVDNALHDAWGRVADRNVFEMYTADHLADDLSAFGLPGRYPDDGVEPSPRQSLPVQHLVGISDQLTPAGDGAITLGDWIAREGISRLKVKVAGADPAVDAQRISEVYRAARSQGVRPHLAVDPNEGYPDATHAETMLDELSASDPEAAAAVQYLEQPIPRSAVADPGTFRRLSERVPTIMDEGFTALAHMPQLRTEGWSGVVIKAGKGQTPAVIAAAVARHLGLFVAVQDLTATGLAFVHSARIASSLRVSVSQLEYNSRQYAPAGNDAIRRTAPRLCTVVAGEVWLDGLNGPGLYGRSVAARLEEVTDGN
ncbi:mandelate racemase/muconate lactonizing enzyme family protein [Ruania alkalisoli]|uniref:Mandelate racemase/muconate lactonizing enzyme family protein n=1 Tax=Ruania alkalisoli TaxID=2779775 RepID=A0A7M1SUC5_9MICO|nr:mandelate racemase/muconate lactonizing enzyme family protein [Ruania alkalisoli]QOR71135.1 mandelate racemase/muconate lactonizing enzyme family protein [Ruania alkalisoli]